jgi:hypothetical protein
MFRSNHTAMSVRIHDARRQWLGSVSKSMKKRQPEVLLLRYRKRTSLSVVCFSCVVSNHRLFGPVIGDFRIETPPISWLSDGRVILITEKGGLHVLAQPQTRKVSQTPYRVCGIHFRTVFMLQMPQ